MQQKRLSILLLCDDRPGNANTILDHIDAFRRYSRHQIRTYNPLGMSRSVALDLAEFDAVVLHYSVILSNSNFIAPRLYDKLRRYRGLKIQLIQDDFRWVDRATSASREVGVRVLFTAVLEPAAGQLYDDRLPGVRRVQTLTGYVSENLLNLPLRPLHERSIDVGYRGRDLPFWLGRLTQDKVLIGQRFLELAPRHSLRCDIGWMEKDRIYGQDWIDFIRSCRATLGAESGASIADFDGRAEEAVRQYLRHHNTATFDEVHAAVLQPFEGNVVANVISPRVFEAAALGTGLVMFPGDYSSVVSAGEHYIVLEKDFSNMDEVAERLKDDRFMTALTKRAHDHLVKSGRWSFASFIREFDDVVAEESDQPRGSGSAPRYRLARIERSLRVPPPHKRLVRGALNAVSKVRGRDLARRSEIESGSWLTKGLMALRAVLGNADLRSVFRAARRGGMAVDSALEEILELWLLRGAIRQTLDSDKKFTVSCEFDSNSGRVRFVSVPDEPGWSKTDPQAANILEAVRAGGINEIEWDHTAVGRSIQLLKPRVEVGIGTAGFKGFLLLVEIGRRNPALLERVLAPVVGEGSRSGSLRQ